MLCFLFFLLCQRHHGKNSNRTVQVHRSSNNHVIDCAMLNSAKKFFSSPSVIRSALTKLMTVTKWRFHGGKGRTHKCSCGTDFSSLPFVSIKLTGSHWNTFWQIKSFFQIHKESPKKRIHALGMTGFFLIYIDVVSLFHIFAIDKKLSFPFPQVLILLTDPSLSFGYLTKFCVWLILC